MSVRHQDSPVAEQQPSLKPVWIALAVTTGLAVILELYTLDPQDWFPYAWDVLPISYDTWGTLLAWTYAALLVLMLVPIVLGVRAVRAGRVAAWWPTALAIVIFCAWGLFCLGGLIMYQAVGGY